MSYKRHFTADTKPLPLRIGQILKRGYEIELIQPGPVAELTANMAGRAIKPLPVFRKA